MDLLLPRRPTRVIVPVGWKYSLEQLDRLFKHMADIVLTVVKGRITSSPLTSWAEVFLASITPLIDTVSITYYFSYILTWLS